MLCKDLFYRGTGFNDRLSGAFTLYPGQSIDLLTYLNACSWSSWKQYTSATAVSFHLIVSGDLEITYTGNSLEYMELKRTEFASCTELSEDKRELVYRYPDNNETLLGAEISALSTVIIHEGYFTVTIDESVLNDIRISIATTTCRKEAYILKNIELIKREILEGDDDIKDHLDLHVVDNGNTLDASQVVADHVYLHPNPNTGGSGGFARGMIETLHQKTPATHILLMDDDVLILPESIKRTYHLLRLIRSEYSDRFINGAMLRYEKPNEQHEDLGTISQGVLFEPLKPAFDHSDPLDVVKCAGGYYNNPITYAAWWYCCIPMGVVKKNGLPMPFFVRGDDSEYSLRCKAKFISMNGICLWHLGFALKFSAAMDIYQQFRNLHIAEISSDIMPGINMHDIYKAFFHNDIRKFNYCACDLYLKSMEDFLKGPDFLESCDGEALLKENNSLCEKTVPLSEHPEISVHEIRDVYAEQMTPFFRRIRGRIAWSLFDNGHKFPALLKASGLPVAAFDFSVQLSKMAGFRRYASVNPYTNMVSIREMDRDRYRSIMKKFKILEKEYKKNKNRLKDEYRKKYSYFRSEEFWTKYLGLR